MSSEPDHDIEKAFSQNVWDNYEPKLKFPPDREEFKLYGDRFIEDWKNVFSRHVWNTPHFDQLVLHVIIGQLPSIKKIKITIKGTELDMRIHGCLFQDSGSGKGRGFNFAKYLCDLLGMMYQPITEITDAALIGTVETVKEYQPKKGEKYVSEVKHGWLHETSGIDIFAMSEAEVLFTSKFSKYAKNAMTYYQIAMNTLGTPDSWIVKKLSNGDPILCKPTGSFLLTSYLPENVSDTIIRRGFLQRMIVVVNKITTEQRYNNAMTSIDGLCGNEFSEVTMYDIAERLKIIDKFYSTQKGFKITEEAKDFFKVALDDLFEPLYQIGQFQRAKLEEFVHRWLEIIYKLSFHHMILRLGLTLNVNDVAYAKNYLVAVWMTLTSFIEDALVESHGEKSKKMMECIQAIEAYKIFKNKKFNDGWVPEPLLTAFLAKKWQVQKRTAANRIGRLTYEDGYFRVETKGMTPYLYLVKEPKPTMTL